jgi:hypothetical protein
MDHAVLRDGHIGTRVPDMPQEVGALIRFVSATAIATPMLARSVFAGEHLGHYAYRARANDRGFLAELLTQPVCVGTTMAAVGTTR